jgi:hypothetical protein
MMAKMPQYAEGMQALEQQQAPQQSSGWGGLIPRMLDRGLQAAGPIQQPPPRPQRPSMQQMIAQQPPMQNPWAGQRQVQQQGFQPPQQRPQFAQAQVPQWMQANPGQQPQVPPNQMRQQMMAQHQGQMGLPPQAQQGRQQMMSQMLRRRSSHVAGGE